LSVALLAVAVAIGIAGLLGLTFLLTRPGRSPVRHLLVGVTVLLVSAPLSVVVTLLLLPVWRSIEARYGIEAVGHSGPAEWCYGAVFLACVSTLGGVYAFTMTRGTRRDAS
jgi:hypothetical protein